MALGAFSLTKNNGSSDLAVTSAGNFVCDAITGLTGMQALAVQLWLAYGSGGTSLKAFLQTSLDQGNTWFDIACVVFNTASEKKLLNFSALTPKITQVEPTDGTLTDDTAVDGLIGDRVRLKGTIVGTYGGNTLLSGRMVAR